MKNEINFYVHRIEKGERKVKYFSSDQHTKVLIIKITSIYDKCLLDLATDAYGYIKFEESSSKPAPYIRISSDADQEQ
jgi:hypothetical protein